MKDCCWENIEKAKWVSRATWKCGICGKDVSLLYVLYNQHKLPKMPRGNNYKHK